MSAMDKNATLAAEIRAWMRGVMAEKRLTVTAWAKAAGVARTTIARPLKEDYEFVVSSRTLAALAAAAGVQSPGAGTSPDASAQNNPKLGIAFLPVLYSVCAGHWIEANAGTRARNGPPRPVSSDPRYTAHPQWLEAVEGDGMDREIPAGWLVHVVDTASLNYTPQDGDFVIVERRRDGGALRERSVRQVSALPGGGVELWARSSNAAWASPLSPSSSSDNDSDIEVEVVGLVIGAYRPFK